jgi:cytochrome b involved in lipid metabolism
MENFDNKTFKQPIEKPKNEEIDKNYKVEITSADTIPEGNKITFMSNNQIYKKKEDIEYAKKSPLEFYTKMRDNKDPLGVQAKGGLKGYTMEEIKKHNNAESLWTVLNGNVYDLTCYLDYHPGGEKKLLMGAGKDCTSLFGKMCVNFRKISPLGKL